MVRLIGCIVSVFFVNQAVAEDVGIRFWEMEAGTRWVIERLEDKVREEETFMGKEGDYFITEEVHIKPSGERRFIFKNFYDAKGRRVRGERNGMAVTFKPFQCRYVVGDCTEASSIPWEYTPDNEKHFERTSKRKNRLDGDMFYVGWFLSSGELKEFPFKLGKYNLRISSEYKNNLGETRGFRLVELFEP